MFGNFAPAGEGHVHDGAVALWIIGVAVGEDGKLCANGGATEIGCNVSIGLEPADIIVADFGIRVSKMIEPAVGASHGGGNFGFLGGQRLGQAACQACDGFVIPRRIDELVHQLNVPDADLIRQH